MTAQGLPTHMGTAVIMSEIMGHKHNILHVSRHNKQQSGLSQDLILSGHSLAFWYTAASIMEKLCVFAKDRTTHSNQFQFAASS